MPKAENDRRRHIRSDLMRPCRLFVPDMEKYLHGMTCNISLGGLLIQISRPYPLKPGDILRVGIALDDRQGFMQARDMFEASVVRAFGTPSGQMMVALKCDKTSLPLQTPLSKAA